MPDLRKVIGTVGWLCCAGGAMQGLRVQHIAVRAYPAVWEAGYVDLSQYARTEQ